MPQADPATVPGAELALEPRLRGFFEEAIARVPWILGEGWSGELDDGLGPRACRVVLIDPNGRRMPERVRAQRGRVFLAYRRFADLVYRLEASFPGRMLRLSELAWGGNWTAADGRWQVAHWDLGGFRGHGVYRKPEIPDRVTQRDSGKPQERRERTPAHQG